MARSARRSPTALAEGAGGRGPHRAHRRLGLCQLGRRALLLGLEPGRLALGVLERGQAGRASLRRRP